MSGTVKKESDYPEGATPIIAGSGNVAAAVATATIAAVANRTAYLTGFDITSDGATAAAAVRATVTGLLGGTIGYSYAAAAGVTVQDQTLSMRFNPPLPASAVNQAIAVSLPSLGAGNTNAEVNAYGYYI